MASKLNANAPIFVPRPVFSTNTPVLSDSQHPQQTWTQIQCLEEFIGSFNPKLKQHKEGITSLQNELKSYFTLSYSFNDNVLKQLNVWKNHYKSLHTMYDTLTDHLIKMKTAFCQKYPHYIHQHSEPIILLKESTKNPSQKHDLLLFGYVRKNTTNQMPKDIIHLLQSFVTHFVETEMIWNVENDILPQYKSLYPSMTALSDSFYCDDIEFMLSLETGFHLNFKSYPIDASVVTVSYCLYHMNTATLFQNTEIVNIEDELQLSGCRIDNKMIRNAKDVTLGCNVRILSVVHNDGRDRRVKQNKMKMRNNFVHHWMMNDMLSTEIRKSRKGKKWNSDRFDGNNWCLSVYKCDKWKFRFGLKLLQLPHNIGKIAVKYGINGTEYQIEMFSYQQPLHLWKMCFLTPPIEQFALIISVQIMAVFDNKGQYTCDWNSAGVV